MKQDRRGLAAPGRQAFGQEALRAGRDGFWPRAVERRRRRQRRVRRRLAQGPASLAAEEEEALRSAPLSGGVLAVVWPRCVSAGQEGSRTAGAVEAQWRA